MSERLAPRGDILPRLVGSSRLPFAVRSRVSLWQRRASWSSRRPVTFNEKVQWKLLRDRRPLLTTFADKVAVRDYVARVVGPDLLSECYAVVSHPGELERIRLPREFVVKPNHASGAAWIVSDRALPAAPARRLPDRGWSTVITSPDALEWDMLVASCRAWLSRNYGDEHLEWAYRDIPPQILVEELLSGPEGRVAPIDYKFFVFHGRVRLVQVDTDRHTFHRRNLYLPDWTSLDVQGFYPRADTAIPCPQQLERMLEVAEALGSGTDLVRVDLYQLPDRVVFGELTNYPDGGYQTFTPASFDVDLGRWWNPPRKYR